VDVPGWYISACSNFVQYVRLYRILMSVLLHNYKDLTGCIEEVERIEDTVNKKKRLTRKEEGKEEQPTTLDNFLTNH
jgi:hypothetical protein